MSLRRQPGDENTPRAQRVALRLAGHIHPPLLAYPERVVINVAAIVIGISALWPPRGGAVDTWPDWFAYEWAAGMIAGGGAALHGTWTGYRPSERLGAGLFAVCAAIFAVTAAVEYGWSAVGTVVIFGCLTGAKIIRIIRSLAVSAEITTSINNGEVTTGGQTFAVDKAYLDNQPDPPDPPPASPPDQEDGGPPRV